MTLILQGTDNSVSSPAVQGGTAGTTTGVYYPATNQIALATNGTLALIANAKGDIGLGTTPASWGSAWRAVQLGTQASWYTNNDFSRFALNVYGDSVYTERYLETDNASQYIQASGNHTFMGADSGTAGNAITWTTMLNFKKDNTVALQGASFVSGTGITFPATQNASSNANTLDDYEEGTWTPAFNGQSSATYTTQTGRYCKIGNIVTVQALISWSAFTASGSNLQLGGLPFNPDTTYSWTNGLTVGITNGTTYSQVTQYLATTSFFFYTASGSLGGSASPNPFGSSGSITIYGTYFAST